MEHPARCREAPGIFLCLVWHLGGNAVKSFYPTPFFMLTEVPLVSVLLLLFNVTAISSHEGHHPVGNLRYTRSR